MSAADSQPPSYSEAMASPPPVPPPSLIAHHLRTLPARLRASQNARHTAQAAREFDITSLLVPHIEAFLADVTAAAPPRAEPDPFLAELTLVPAAAVPPGWAMTGAAERRREGELVRVARVTGYAEGDGGDQKGKGEEGGATKGAAAAAAGSGRASAAGDDEDGDGRRADAEASFDDWGRFETDETDAEQVTPRWWWFRDEDMARRVAAYLRPEPNLERQHVQAVVAERKAAKESKSPWGRLGLGGSSRKKAAAAAAEQQQPSPSPTSPGRAGAADDDSVKMTVRADEVTFRRENEMGLWESRSGFGIVVTLRISRP